VVLAFVSQLFSLFRQYLDVFLKSGGPVRRLALSPEINHTNHGNVAAGRQRQNVNNSNRLTRSFHGPGIESYPLFGAIGAGDGPAFAETCLPKPPIDPSDWPLLVHVDVAPS
jgi:hypothetical protein